MIIEQNPATELLPTPSPSEQEGESPLKQQDAELQQKLTQALEQLRLVEEEKQDILDQMKRSKKKTKLMLQLSGVVALLYAILRFHREMGQVGWSWLQAAADIFNITPEYLCGIALFSGSMYLLCKLFLCTIEAAAEDFMKEGNDDDLADR